MMMIPGENDGVEAVEDPECSDAATTRHGFFFFVWCCVLLFVSAKQKRRCFTKMVGLNR